MKNEYRFLYIAVIIYSFLMIGLFSFSIINIIDLTAETKIYDIVFCYFSLIGYVLSIMALTKIEQQEFNESLYHDQ